MRNFQLLGIILVVAGSFLPLVHVPVIGNWNFWKIEPVLAMICWVFSSLALVGFALNKTKIIRLAAIFLIFLFGFTIYATKQQSMDFFSFLPFKKLQNIAAGTVKLQWGWLLEFAGAALLLFSKNSK